MYTFYQHRDFNLEYWGRQFIYNPLIHPTSEFYMKYNEISSIHDLHFFMNRTIANQIFEPQKNKENGSAPREPSSYIFQKGNIPLGKMRIR